MTKKDSFLAGIGIGLLTASVALKLFDLLWLAVSLGALLLIIGGTGLTSKKK